jgi:CheY-like chemotaxis protein
MSNETGTIHSVSPADCPNIVILEDDEDIRVSIQEVLEMDGYKVAAFANGQEALDGMGACQNACLILCDLMMPIMTGSEFLDARKQMGDTFFAIPVFIVSAWPEQAKDRTDVKGFIKKPIDLNLLLNVVRHHCGDAVKRAS